MDFFLKLKETAERLLRKRSLSDIQERFIKGLLALGEAKRREVDLNMQEYLTRLGAIERNKVELNNHIQAIEATNMELEKIAAVYHEKAKAAGKEVAELDKELQEFERTLGN